MAQNAFVAHCQYKQQQKQRQQTQNDDVENKTAQKGHKAQITIVSRFWLSFSLTDIDLSSSKTWLWLLQDANSFQSIDFVPKLVRNQSQSLEYTFSN